jgi:hypothetical protein
MSIEFDRANELLHKPILSSPELTELLDLNNFFLNRGIVLVQVLTADASFDGGEFSKKSKAWVENSKELYDCTVYDAMIARHVRNQLMYQRNLITKWQIEELTSSMHEHLEE